MANLGNFDARQVEPQGAFDPLPAGWYNVQITQSEMKPTRANDGAYLELGMKVIDGQYAGRMLFDRLNLQNKNPVASEIAYRTLSAICHATGVMQVQNSEQLHGIPLQAKVTVRPANADYDASNEVKGYRSANEGKASTPPAAGGFQPRPPAAAPAAPPTQTGGAPSFTPPWNGAAQPSSAPAQAPQPEQTQAPEQAPAQAPTQGGGQPAVSPPWAR